VEYNWTELREYRKKEIEEAVILISAVFKGGSPDYLQGIMDMFKRIILLPHKLCRKEEREFIEDMINQEFKLVEIDLLRSVVRD